jgi:hypothetical protein
MTNLDAPSETQPAPVGYLLRITAVASLILAGVLILPILLRVTGLEDRLLASSDAGIDLWKTYRSALSGVGTFLWFLIVPPLWMRSRSTAGFALMTATFLVWLTARLLDFVWPEWFDGPAAIFWTGYLCMLLWPLLLGLGLKKSAFLHPLVPALALAWGLTGALYELVLWVVNAWFSDALAASARFDSAVAAWRYIPSFLLIAFLVALGLSVLVSERFASVFSRLRIGQH